MSNTPPEPRTVPYLFGHAKAEAGFLDAFRSGRFHHAWLITGPAGIGKATFAFRAARYLFEHPDPSEPGLALHADLSVDAASPSFAKVAAGAHPNLLHLTRPYDDKAKRLKTEIPVDLVRRTQTFFGTTAAEEGWRICIVDSADDLNANAANTLLKNLEEPTARGLYLIVCHNPGRLLPTIRSRCRVLRMTGLDRNDLDRAVRTALEAQNLTVPEDDLVSALEASRGSVGKALIFLESGGLDVMKGLKELAARFPTIDRRDLHGLAQSLAAREAESRYDLFCDLAYDLAADRVRSNDNALGSRLRWSQAGQDILEIGRQSRIFNLDRKQAVIQIVETLAGAAGSPISPEA